METEYRFHPHYHQRWLAYGLAALFALLLHFFFLSRHPEWTVPSMPTRVDVQQIDPQKLDAIKKKWQREKSLLLDKNPKAPSEAEAPDDARYFSDRNIRVKKEQRAKEHENIPKPSSKGGKETKQAKKIPALGKLGLRYKLEPKAPDQAGKAETRGSEAYVEDKSVPDGSETLLNAQESIFYSFYARVSEAVVPLWESNVRELDPILMQRRLQAADYKTIVEVVLDAKGKLVSVTQLQTSGVREFDQAVQESWQKLGEFPNPPQGLLDENGQVRVRWGFTVDLKHQNGIAIAPPERIS